MDEPSDPHDVTARLALARSLYRERRLREAVFADRSIFGEPAWDLLLDLYQSHLLGRSVSVTSACVAAAVPVTTALRWLNALESEGLVHRSGDPSDRRRMLVSLTASAVDLMETYLAQVQPAPGHEAARSG